MTAELENSATAAADNPGELLRLERERVGFTTTEVATHLHLSKTTLTYLEEGRFDRLPGDTFTRGYIRSYARLLKLDPDVFAAHFDRYVGVDSRTVRVSSINRMVPSRSGTRWMVASTLLIVVIMLVLGLWWWNDSRDAGLPPEEADVSALIDDVQVDSMLLPPSSSVPAAQESQEPLELQAETPAPVAGVTDDAQELQEQEPVAEMPATPASTADVEQGPVAEPVIAATDAGQGLHMRFSANCWVKVTAADGRVLHSAEMLPGQSLQIDHLGPLQLVIGAAQAVASIEYNGQPVELTPNRQSGVVRLGLGQ